MIALAHPGEVLDLHLAPGKLLEGKSGGSETADGLAEEDSTSLHESVDKVTRKLILRSLEENQYNLAKVSKEVLVVSTIYMSSIPF